LNVIVLLCLLLSGFGPANVSVHAQEANPETPTPDQVVTEDGTLIPPTGTLFPTETATPPSAETATPTFTPLPTIAPTEKVLSALNLAEAGTGAIYRAQVRLKQPTDLKRLQDWNVKVLQQGNGTVVVQVTPLQLSKLARLGFEPTQIDSVDYMLTVQALTTGEVQSM